MFKTRYHFLDFNEQLIRNQDDNSLIEHVIESESEPYIGEQHVIGSIDIPEDSNYLWTTKLLDKEGDLFVGTKQADK